MSFIAAVNAKQRVTDYLGNSFDSGDTARKGMTADASNDIARTIYGAQKYYNGTVGRAKVEGIRGADTAAAGAQQNMMIGGMMGTLGSALNPMASTIKNQGLFGFPKPGS